MKGLLDTCCEFDRLKKQLEFVTKSFNDSRVILFDHCLE
jgi:hypothetical protein